MPFVEEDHCSEHHLGVLGASVTSSVDWHQQPARITTSTSTLEMEMHQSEWRAEMNESKVGIHALLIELKQQISQLAGFESRILPAQSIMETLAGSLAAQTTTLDSLCYAVEQLRADNAIARRFSKVSLNKRASPPKLPSPNLAASHLASMLQPPNLVPAPDDAPSFLAGSSSTYSRHSKASFGERPSLQQSSGERMGDGSKERASAPLGRKLRQSDAAVPNGLKKPASRAQSLASSNERLISHVAREPG